MNIRIDYAPVKPAVNIVTAPVGEAAYFYRRVLPFESASPDELGNAARGDSGLHSKRDVVECVPELARLWVRTLQPLGYPTGLAFTSESLHS